VRDTPLEKTNHEATAKHQGNLRKFLRELHKDNERAERDKQRAKDEVARLNGTTPQSSNGDGLFKSSVTFTKTASKQASVEDRKRQMAQLASLGVAVPEDFRRENAMAGDWQTVSQRVIWETESSKTEEQDIKYMSTIEDKKRKLGDEDEIVPELKEGKRRPRYGRDIKALPDDDEDLEALLGATTSVKKKIKTEPARDIETEAKENTKAELTKDSEKELVAVPDSKVKLEAQENETLETPTVDTESGELFGSIFKKRKPKTLRQK
jgi:hypothetical protein